MKLRSVCAFSVLGLMLAACAGESGRAASSTSSDTASIASIPLAKSGTRLASRGYSVAAAPFDQDLFHDIALDVDCHVAMTGAATVSCVPTQVARQIFLDSSCTAPGISIAETPATYVAVKPVAGGVETIAKVGAPSAAATYQTASDGACQAVTFATEHAYAATAVPLASFVAGTVAQTPIGSDLARSTVTFSDGAVGEYPGARYLLDSNAACQPSVSDGPPIYSLVRRVDSTFPVVTKVPNN